MENPTKNTPKDVFLHLLSAATLYLSVIGFIALWWQYIGFIFPDKLNLLGYGSSIYNTILWSTSVLIVSYPVYILISWIIGRDFKTDASRRESRVRKWLWYITLFVAAMTMIIDLITLIFNFLKGDLTTQFFLKTVIVLVVAAAVFGYYLWDLRKRDKISTLPKKMAWLAGAIILASVAYGFFLVGSPATQRNLRFDEQRATDLQQIQSFVANYWQQKSALPKNLGELRSIGYTVPNDPETSQPYSYSVTGSLTFKLCADFKAASPLQPAGASLPYYSSVGVATVPQNWVHKKGNICFDSTIDPSFFKQSPVPGTAPAANPAPVPTQTK